ncbi:hypothetical protein [Litchfieldia alkalitelluris]|uniref:hypothetical protein n=1 Tax=Litchfieldia alkalitelluris TaxID=304268 RepID=UPI000998E7C8|nr:hypothetical protein [Litchfieldia alkalitelluris]
MNGDRAELIIDLDTIYDNLYNQHKKIQQCTIKNRIYQLMILVQNLKVDVMQMPSIESPKGERSKKKLSKKEKKAKAYNNFRAKNSFKKVHMAPKGKSASRSSTLFNASGTFKYSNNNKGIDYDD